MVRTMMVVWSRLVEAIMPIRLCDESYVPPSPTTRDALQTSAFGECDSDHAFFGQRCDLLGRHPSNSPYT